MRPVSVVGSCSEVSRSVPHGSSQLVFTDLYLLVTYRMQDFLNGDDVRDVLRVKENGGKFQGKALAMIKGKSQNYNLRACLM